MQAISWVIENSKQKLGNLIVLFMVANHAKSDGTGAWPSLSTLAREARMTERQVRRCLRILEKSGELTTRMGKGPHGTNLYSLPGVKLSGGGGHLRQGGGTNRTETRSKMSPEPSLTVNKDKEEPRAQPRAVSPSLLAKMSEQEWQEHLNKLDPKRKGASA